MSCKVFFCFFALLVAVALCAPAPEEPKDLEAEKGDLQTAASYGYGFGYGRGFGGYYGGYYGGFYPYYGYGFGYPGYGYYGYGYPYYGHGYYW